MRPIVAYYFDARRSFATGISVCGSGVGTFVFAEFTQFLVEKCNGWRGACIVLAGVFLNMIICGLLFRDLEWTKTLRVNKKIDRRKSKSSEQLKTGSSSSVSSPSRYVYSRSTLNTLVILYWNFFIRRQSLMTLLSKHGYIYYMV